MIRILRYSAHEIFARPDIVARLRFLTNGGWGRHEIGSVMLLDLEAKRPGHYYLAWEDGVIVAWASLSKRGSDRRFQFQCYTAAPHRRRGIGKRLMGRALANAKSRRIDVVVIPWNDVGYKFYANCDSVDYESCWQPYSGSLPLKQSDRSFNF